MNRKWLNVWNFPMPKKYYLRHPRKLFLTILKCRKWMWQRIRTGFCDGDCWEMKEWFCQVIPQMLRVLAEKGQAYPGSEPFETPEKWHEWLIKTAANLEKCSEEYIVPNEYEEPFHKICTALQERQKENENETFTVKENIIKHKYFTRIKEIDDEKKELLKTTLTEIAEHFYDLWD